MALLDTVTVYNKVSDGEAIDTQIATQVITPTGPITRLIPFGDIVTQVERNMQLMAGCDEICTADIVTGGSGKWMFMCDTATNTPQKILASNIWNTISICNIPTSFSISQINSASSSKIPICLDGVQGYTSNASFSATLLGSVCGLSTVPLGAVNKTVTCVDGTLSLVDMASATLNLCSLMDVTSLVQSAPMTTKIAVCTSNASGTATLKETLDAWGNNIPVQGPGAHVSTDYMMFVNAAGEFYQMTVADFKTANSIP
jgi:hypothetical protein